LIVLSQRTVGPASEADQTVPRDGKEPAVTLQDVFSPVDDEVVALSNAPTSQDVADILAEIDPRECDRIHIAMR